MQLQVNPKMNIKLSRASFQKDVGEYPGGFLLLLIEDYR